MKDVSQVKFGKGNATMAIGQVQMKSCCFFFSFEFSFFFLNNLVGVKKRNPSSVGGNLNKAMVVTRSKEV